MKETPTENRHRSPLWDQGQWLRLRHRMQRCMVATGVLFLVLGSFAPAVVYGLEREEQQELQELQKELKRLQERVKALEAQQAEEAKEPKEPKEAKKANNPKEQETITRRLLYDGLLPGFIPIPGTDTQFRIGGYVRTEVIHDFKKLNQNNINGFYTRAIPVSGESGNNKGGDTFITSAATRVSLDLRTPETHVSETFDDLRVFVEGDFWPDASAFRIRHAFGEWGPLLVGETWDTWSDITALPLIFDFAGPPNAVGFRTPQVRWTQPLGRGFSLTAAVENPGAEITIPVVSGTPVAEVENWLPDFVLAGRYEAETWHLHLAGMLRGLKTQGDTAVSDDSTLGWGLFASGKVTTFGKDTVGFALTGGEGIGHYLNATETLNFDAVLTPTGLETIPLYGGFANYTHYWLDNLQSSVMYGYVGADNIDAQAGGAFKETNYVLANILWAPFPLVHIGIEYLYGTRENNDGASGDAHRLTVGFVYSFDKVHPHKNWLWGGS